MSSKRLRAQADDCFTDIEQRVVKMRHLERLILHLGRHQTSTAFQYAVTESHIDLRIRPKRAWNKATMKRLLRLMQIVIDDGIEVSGLAFGELATCSHGIMHIRIGRYPGVLLSQTDVHPFLGL
ncbi:hypothetical protein [uncultured Thiodictyon sp.]|uniref:hypothetical protein n=1 Tax=uncultured Thiodictyon sp. TaxID=1846217 RepID=UPI0025FA2394|nr:hypothetical protein [uncultured Thiodictyon sp.]